MATTPKQLFRGAAATSNTTLYTVPSATTTIISSIVVTNTSSSNQTFNLTLDGVSLHSTSSILANQSIYIDLKQVLSAADLIEGLASATSVNFHIAGVEIA